MRTFIAILLPALVFTSCSLFRSAPKEVELVMGEWEADVLSALSETETENLSAPDGYRLLYTFKDDNQGLYRLITPGDTFTETFTWIYENVEKGDNKGPAFTLTVDQEAYRFFIKESSDKQFKIYFAEKDRTFLMRNTNPADKSDPVDNDDRENQDNNATDEDEDKADEDDQNDDKDEDKDE